MDIFESSKIPLIILWVILFILQIGIFIVSVISFTMLSDDIGNMAEYQSVFIRFPSSYFIPTLEIAMPYQKNDADSNCLSSFEAPLAFMSMSLLNFMHLVGIYYYGKYKPDEQPKASDYSFDCDDYKQFVKEGCDKKVYWCDEYNHSQATSTIGPLVQYLLCGSTSKCTTPVKHSLKYRTPNLEPKEIDVQGVSAMNSTLLVDEAKRFMTIYHQPLLLTFDDFMDRTYVNLKERDGCENHTIPCIDDLFTECCYQDTPIRTYDGNYHRPNVLISTGRLKSVIVVGWDDDYPIPRSDEKGAFIVRDEGASTGHSLQYYSDSNSTQVIFSAEDFTNCHNEHAFVHWNAETNLTYNVDNYLKYLYKLPNGITEKTASECRVTFTSVTERDNQGLMDVNVVAFCGKESFKYKINKVTDSLIEEVFYKPVDESLKSECGFYAIGYNVIQNYFNNHYDTSENPVGFSFIHLKWPDNKKDLKRK
ncbi:hypothetical protein EIN_268290 [Entamoeba invadens IP1]|uniref:Uncharacterized protein n=1 Tax=Entamoeba invadens IP1 TaxID=370355 RepID=A0A0A1U855_ENTIV|nr:hypothetical protein EIN_268290 [Entamoeba invadens IP1]ELP91083.1 hypothetical protein EIN_268290 [Entamoeba invadens IP1]|eukprot:XP_004257854.1 hypothetical protein EIN_268290 [Entamoeba invadens IP1]